MDSNIKMQYYNPNNQLWKIEFNGRVSYIFGTSHIPSNNKLPIRCVEALTNSTFVLSELYGLVGRFPLYEERNNSIMDIQVINQAKGLGVGIVALETAQEHESYAVRIPHYPYRDYGVHKYPVYHRDVIIGYRNRKWMSIIYPYIYNYNTFIAVGFNHVDGILRMLRGYGCRISRV